MSEFNNFGENQQNNGQNVGSFGSTPGDTNNFGSQNIGGQGFDNLGYENQNLGGQNNQVYGNNQNPGNGYQDIGGNFNPGMNGYGQPTPNMVENHFINEASGISVSMWKTLSVIQIIIGCCCGFFPMVCGIISLVFLNKTRDSLLVHDIVSAKANYKTGKVFNLIGWGIIAITTIIGILGFIGGVFEQMFS